MESLHFVGAGAGAGAGVVATAGEKQTGSATLVECNQVLNKLIEYINK